MGTTYGPQIRTVADIVQVLTKCSKPEANAAEDLICKSPKSIAILATACGIGGASVAFGGRLIVAGAVTSGGSIIPGVILGAAGVVTARRFCRSMINQTKSAIAGAQTN